MDLQFFFFCFYVGTIAAGTPIAVLAWLAEQLLLGVFVRLTGWSFGIGYMAHVGGLIAGFGLAFCFTRLGISATYREMIARLAAPYMICPGCKHSMLRRGAGRYRCSGCRTRFQIDEVGNITIRDTSKYLESQWELLMTFLYAFICLGLILYRICTRLR